jgi:hypothetical protein
MQTKNKKPLFLGDFGSYGNRWVIIIDTDFDLKTKFP